MFNRKKENGLLSKTQKYLHSFFPISFFLGLLILGNVGCDGAPEMDQATVLIAGHEKISLEAFRNRYELDPTFPGYRKGEAGLKEYAERIVDKILSEKLARKEGLLDSLPLRKHLTHQRNMAAIRALMRQEVTDRMEITEQEIRAAYQKMAVRIHVKHLFSPDKSTAETLYRSLQSGTSFDTLAEQVFAKVDPRRGGSDLGEITWGDLPPSLEAAAYHLIPGNYSRPVKSPWGYHILLVTNRRENIMLTEGDYQQKRPQIIKKLKQRRRKELANQYLKNYLDPLDIKVKKEAFSKIIRILEIYDEGQQKIPVQSMQPITADEIERLRNYLQDDLKQLFMTSNQENWSIEYLLNLIEDLPLEKRPEITSVDKFKDDIGKVIRNAFLLKRAKKLGIDADTKVDSTVKWYARKIAYHFYLKKKYEKYQPPENVIFYYQNRYKKDHRIQEVPETILSGMNSVQSYRIYYAQVELHNDLIRQFPEVNIQINNSLLKGEVNRVKWDNPIRMFVTPLD